MCFFFFFPFFSSFFFFFFFFLGNIQFFHNVNARSLNNIVTLCMSIISFQLQIYLIHLIYVCLLLLECKVDQNYDCFYRGGS
jgi:hypothetical protein